MSKRTSIVTINNDFSIIPDQPYIDLIATGRNLKRIRKQKKFTQAQTADFFYGNLSIAAISAWENGKSLPDYKHLIILGNIYGYRLDELLVVVHPEKEAS